MAWTEFVKSLLNGLPDIRGALGVGVGEAWRGCSAGLSGCAVMRAGLGRSLLSGVADIGMSPGAAVEVPEWRGT